MSIARALAKTPSRRFRDEPTGALDYRTGKQVLGLLQDTCRKTGRTVIVITHNTALTGMADRIISGAQCNASCPIGSTSIRCRWNRSSGEYCAESYRKNILREMKSKRSAG